jgi:tetratricopeptide (TPR) repeat protein
MMRVINTCTLLIVFGGAATAQPEPFTAGVEAYSRGNYTEAEKLLQQAAKASTDDRVTAWLAIAVATLGQCDEAQAGLARAFDASHGETSRLAGLTLAQCAMAAEDFTKAGLVVGQLRSRFPGDEDVLYQSARYHMRAWNGVLQELYKSAPASYRVNQISGEILETQGQFDAAAQEYRKAIAKNPKAINLHYRLGRTLLLSSHDPGNLEAARHEFEAELALNPGDAIAHFQVGQILSAQQQREAAIKRLENALQLRPEFPEALVALAKLKMNAKRTDEAIALLEQAVALQPKNESAHYSLMLAYRDAGRADAAQRQKQVLDQLKASPAGEFSDFLKKIGEKPPE